MARCPLTGKPYCVGPTRLDDCFGCDLREDKREEYDRQLAEEYEAYLNSQREKYEEE